ncbi:MAG: hypothetical protein D4R74_01885 [Betaproteobacteria bacterium]|nr:MAG: hypothetical protein D4R74_01885 [Betaproteobacteria bacterium]
MNRRDALHALLVTLVAAPATLAAPAYAQKRVWRIVSLTGNAEKTVAEPLEGFRKEMKALRY